MSWLFMVLPECSKVLATMNKKNLPKTPFTSKIKPLLPTTKKTYIASFPDLINSL